MIREEIDGSHGGSMRFLPTTGPTVVNDVFGHLTGSAPIQNPLIWKCTRFSLARGAGANVAAALMPAGGEIMTNFGIRHFVGLFDARMQRIYRLIGSTPEVLGSQGKGHDRISAGLWAFTPEAQARAAERAGISPELSRIWFNRSFGIPVRQRRALSA